MGQVESSELQRRYNNLTSNSSCSEIFYEDDDGHNLLIKAVANNSIDNVKFLLEKGVDINHHNNYGNTALHFAVINKNLNMVKLLIEKGADYNYKNIVGRTPYDVAMKKRYCKIIACISRTRRLAERANRLIDENKSNNLYREAKENNEVSFLLEFKGNNEDCSICSETMTSGKSLSCGHSFHGGCIGEWIIEKRECPLCRRKITLG